MKLFPETICDLVRALDHIKKGLKELRGRSKRKAVTHDIVRSRWDRESIDIPELFTLLISEGLLTVAGLSDTGAIVCPITLDLLMSDREIENSPLIMGTYGIDLVSKILKACRDMAFQISQSLSDGNNASRGDRLLVKSETVAYGFDDYTYSLSDQIFLDHGHAMQWNGKAKEFLPSVKFIPAKVETKVETTKTQEIIPMANLIVTTGNFATDLQTAIANGAITPEILYSAIDDYNARLEQVKAHSIPSNCAEVPECDTTEELTAQLLRLAAERGITAAIDTSDEDAETWHGVTRPDPTMLPKPDPADYLWDTSAVETNGDDIDDCDREYLGLDTDSQPRSEQPATTLPDTASQMTDLFQQWKNKKASKDKPVAKPQPTPQPATPIAQPTAQTKKQQPIKRSVPKTPQIKTIPLNRVNYSKGVSVLDMGKLMDKYSLLGQIDIPLAYIDSDGAYNLLTHHEVPGILNLLNSIDITLSVIDDVDLYRSIIS